MEKRGFYFNQDACIGCRVCQIACKDKNNLQAGVLFRSVRTYETGAFPNPGLYHYSGACNNCAQAVCITTCPTGAMHEDPDGTVSLDRDRCVRCGNCVRNCPYGAPQYLDINGLVGKCDSCRDLLDRGENPACVDACPMRVLEFGAMEKLREKHSEEYLVDSLPCLPASASVPSILIRPRSCALIGDFTEKKEP